MRQDGTGVVADIETPHGMKTLRGRYMLGCGGGRSQVRKSMNVEFEGFTYDERFLILSTRYDFEPFGYALTNYIADPEQWCALFKVPGHDGKGMWRVVFPVDNTTPVEALYEEANVQRLIQGFHKIDGDYTVAHRNVYQVHQRVASCYRDRRILVAGDAAHINNPLGGMGMNFGFHDVFNLVEKLARIWFEGASEDLLDLYDRRFRNLASPLIQAQPDFTTDIQNAVSMLFRLQRQGVDQGAFSENGEIPPTLLVDETVLRRQGLQNGNDEA